MRRSLVKLVLASLLVSKAAASGAPAVDCDRLAAHPLDQHRVAAGVDWHQLDGAAALQACAAAAANFPGEARFDYQRARALDRVGRTDEAIPIYQALASRSYAAAQTMLAYLYSSGDGVPRDPALAAALFQAAAEQGHPEAQLQLGLLHRRDAGVLPDRGAAALWLGRSAAQGYRDGQLALADLLADEARLTLDKTKFSAAAEWYRLAAAQGSEPAHIALGRLNLEGRGVARDVARAIELLQPAAERGDAEAQYWLAIALSADRDAGNDGAAPRWYRRAAQQNYAPAQVALIGVYQNGALTERSPADAYVWARMYARFAPRYERVAEHIARELTKAELAQATSEFERLRAIIGTP